MGGFAALIPAAASVVGSVLNANSRGEQLGNLQRISELLRGIQLPTQAELGAQPAPTALAGVTTNPADAAAQQEALAQMLQVGRQGGMDIQGRAALNEALGRAAVVGNAARRGAVSDAEARGMGGAGTTLASAMEGGQAGANQALTGGLQAASDARQRALQSMMGAGQMAGQMRGQEFGEKSRVAEAQDAINRYNTGAKSYAAQAAYEDAMQRAMGTGGAMQNQANAQVQQGNFLGNMASSIGTGAGQAVQAFAPKDYWNSWQSGGSTPQPGSGDQSGTPNTADWYANTYGAPGGQ